MTRRAYAYFVLTFVLGVVVGAGGLFIYGVQSGKWHPPFNREHLIKSLAHDLELSTAQVSQLRQIMEDTGKQRRALEAQIDQQFDVLREQTRNRIRQMLNPKQLYRFNDLVRQHDERRKAGRRP
jgi:Spy/CpxP family protein refolding chaperone